jgi:hypothetical protein
LRSLRFNVSEAALKRKKEDRKERKGHAKYRKGFQAKAAVLNLLPN